MDELVDILDENGKPTGKTCLKSEVHLKGYWHPCIHVWLYTNNNDVLIQKRVATKKEFPNTWDVSVAGHVAAGEDILLAAQREVQEEVGLKLNLNDLHFIGNFTTDFKHHKNFVDREYHYVYLAKLTKPIEQLKIQDEEVSEIQLISIDKLKQVLRDKNSKLNFVPYSFKHLDFVFASINKFINS